MAASAGRVLSVKVGTVRDFKYVGCAQAGH
jgi:hypothetical protein